MRTILILSFFFICIPLLKAQEDLDQQMDELVPKSKNIPVTATFKSPQILNGQSNETMHKHDMLFVVMHRFGDIAGSFGGIQTFYGLDNASDILIGFDYGITNRLSLGVGRTKGAPNGTNTSQRELFYIKPKFRLIRQSTDNRIPVSVTLYANGVASGMQKLNLTTSDADFQKFSDRLSFLTQAIIARKFNDDLSLALLPTYVRRNYVSFMDMNNLFGLGMGGRMKLSHRMALIADYFYSFRSKESKDYFLQQKGFKFYNPLGVGLEMETGGHVFNFIFTNSTAILENQSIPSTSSSWTKGGFRWGFSITRTFTFKKPDTLNKKPDSSMN
ncbi:MAG TPA: hypothetical protein DCL77_08845 [Prolixibacteraceae bacterium]|nr:hypothetical protein [Prolixibacteraceae bacterium]